MSKWFSFQSKKSLKKQIQILEEENKELRALLNPTSRFPFNTNDCEIVRLKANIVCEPYVLCHKDSYIEYSKRKLAESAAHLVAVEELGHLDEYKRYQLSLNVMHKKEEELK